MNLTPQHAKYFAHELTKRCASDSVEKLATALSNAQVDLNPHQIEAALFAFRSPLSKGAILADEVGLGKTIEAGILLAQKWAERKRRLFWAVRREREQPLKIGLVVFDVQHLSTPVIAGSGEVSRLIVNLNATVTQGKRSATARQLAFCPDFDPRSTG